MTDLIAKAVALLKSRSAITAVVIEQVHDTDLPEGFCDVPQSTAAIVIREQPDTVYDESAPIVSLALEAHCYGKTVTEARATFRALYDGLRAEDGGPLMNITVDSVKWCSVWIDGGGQPKQDDATGWEFVLCTVRALVRAA